MRHHVSGAIAISLAASVPALAQSASEGFYSSGFVQFEYYDINGINDDLFYIDGTIGFRAGTGNSLTWGAELSADAVHIDGETYDVINATLYLDSMYGRFSAGTPKSVTDSLGARPSFDKTGVSTFGGPSIYSGSLVRLYDLEGDYTPWGIRYDHQIGNTQFGFSANRLEEGSEDAIFYGAAIRHQFDNYSLFATYEFTGGDIPDHDKFSIGAEADFGQLRGGISYGQSDVFSSDFDTAALYVDYDILDNLTAGGEYFRVSLPGDSADAYGVNVDYGFWRNAYVGASVIDGELFGDETAVVGRLGWKLDY